MGGQYRRGAHLKHRRENCAGLAFPQDNLLSFLLKPLRYEEYPDSCQTFLVAEKDSYSIVRATTSSPASSSGTQ